SNALDYELLFTPNKVVFPLNTVRHVEVIYVIHYHSNRFEVSPNAPAHFRVDKTRGPGVSYRGQRKLRAGRLLCDVTDGFALALSYWLIECRCFKSRKRERGLEEGRERDGKREIERGRERERESEREGEREKERRERAREGGRRG
ncbi:hypothetical protein J6590_100480, partial [Homalodisca vitripennis]